MPALFSFGTGAARSYSRIKREERAEASEKEKEKRVLADQITLLNERVKIEDELTTRKEQERSGRLWGAVAQQFGLPDDPAMKQQFMDLDKDTQQKIVQGATLGGLRVRDEWAKAMQPQAEVDPATGVTSTAVPGTRRPMTISEVFEVVKDPKDMKPDDFTAAALQKFQQYQAAGKNPYEFMTPVEISLVDKYANLSERAGKVTEAALAQYKSYQENILEDTGKKKNFTEWLKVQPTWAPYVNTIDQYFRNELNPQGYGFPEASAGVPMPQLRKFGPQISAAPQEEVDVASLMEEEGPPDMGPPVGTDKGNPYARDYRTGEPVISDTSGSTQVRRVAPEGGLLGMRSVPFAKKTPEQIKADEYREEEAMAGARERAGGIKAFMRRQGIDPDKTPTGRNPQTNAAAEGVPVIRDLPAERAAAASVVKQTALKGKELDARLRGVGVDDTVIQQAKQSAEAFKKKTSEGKAEEIKQLVSTIQAQQGNPQALKELKVYVMTLGLDPKKFGL